MASKLTEIKATQRGRILRAGETAEQALERITGRKLTTSEVVELELEVAVRTASLVAARAGLVPNVFGR